MASRVLTPRTAARMPSYLRPRTCSPSTPLFRTMASSSQPKFYPQSTAAASKPASSTPPPPGARATTPASRTTTAKPATTPAASAPKRTPLPPVSGEPLPDAPPATYTPSSPTASSSHSHPQTRSGDPIDWTESYHGIGTSAFAPEVAQTLLAPIAPDDIEVKPDGIIYLPEIKYRRILNRAFGPGGWGLAPREDLIVESKTKMVARDYALVVHGRFVAQARGEQQYFSEDGISTAAEGCKSNALMRCCKDLGVASELWDPRFIRRFIKEHAKQVWAEHATTGKKKMIWLRKDDELRYPFKPTKA
ncbi:Mgm101p-domain-containing protein [Xylariaceae sp. FL0255]|nr:Mgm101p-domain-containing protein [Xylariaceae sp. FL0255]